MATNLARISLEDMTPWTRRFLFAIRDAVPRGDLEAFAHYLQAHYPTLKVAINPACDSHHFRAGWLPPLMDYFDTDEPLHVLAKMRGGVFLPGLDFSGDHEINKQHAKSVRRVGEMMTCHAEHTDKDSDGGERVTRKEWKEREDRSYRALMAVAAYWLYCRERAT